MRIVMIDVVKGMVSGVFFGFVLSVIFSYLAGTGDYAPSTPAFMSKFTTELQALIVSALLWMLIGIISVFSRYIFEYIDGSITKSTLIHLLVVYPSVLIIGFFAGWFPTFDVIIPMTVSFIIIYVIVWLFSYFHYKQQVAQINAQLHVED